MQIHQCFLKIFAVIILTALGSCSGSQDPSFENPNVLLINADDLGYGDLSCYGAIKVKTPNIDNLANQGRRFLDAHSVSAVCSPSRYALLTGEYAFRQNGLFAPIFLRHPLVIDTTQLTLASMLKEAGYATACIGKWHLGFGTESPVDWNKPLKPGPLEVGFDYYFGIPVVNSHPPFVYIENHQVVGYDPDDPFVYGDTAETRSFREKFGMTTIGGARAAHALYNDEQVGTTLKNKAIEWIQANYKNPFFLYLATTNIHHPFSSAPRFQGTSDSGIYGDFIHELDWIVGEVLNSLDELEIADKTLVIFTSDNGGMLNMGGQEAWMAGHHMNGDLFGFKFDAWEGGHRVPFIVRWPGHVEAGSESKTLLSNVDMLATLADIIERPLMDDEGPDSYNMIEAFIGNPKTPIRDHLIQASESRKNIALREGKWVYISSQGGGGFSATKIGSHGFGLPAAQILTHQINSDMVDGKMIENAPPAQLYDLSVDVNQTTNLYIDHPDIVKKMKARLEELIATEQTALIDRNK